MLQPKAHLQGIDHALRKGAREGTGGEALVDSELPVRVAQVMLYDLFRLQTNNKVLH